MTRSYRSSTAGGLLVGSWLALGLAGPALAQAWLPPGGEATFSFGYEYTYVHDHLSAAGQPLSRGDIYDHTLAGYLGYGIRDRWAFSIGLPYVASRYEAPLFGPGKPHQLPIDDGTYHPTFQDFHFELRFMAARGSFVATPFAGYVLPSHDYTYFAHSAVGRDLHELQVGRYLGRRLDPILPDAYAQVRCGFSYVEQVVPGIRPNRSDLDFEVGYFVTPRLTLRLFGAAQWTHGGINVLGPNIVVPAQIFPRHDQIGAVDNFNGGTGAAFAVSGSIDAAANVFQTLSGKNGHAVKLGVGASVTLGFSPRRVIRQMAHKQPSVS